MSVLILGWSLTLAQVILTISMGVAALRFMRGPRAQDRIIGLDTFYVNAMLLLITVGISSGATLYFEAALIIGLLGFVGTVAMSKFLMRGEVIE